MMWPEILAELKNSRTPQPMNVQISPTNKCNVNCDFCSVANRDKNMELCLENIREFLVKIMLKESVLAVELTGGGEPTLHPNIEQLIIELTMANISVGLITNGLTLDNISEDIIERLRWIRISINGILDTGISYIKKLTSGPDIGLSYVLSDRDEDSFDDLINVGKIAKKSKAKYIRVVPNCLDPYYKMDANLETYIQGKPLMFYHPKIPKRPKRCYIGFLKPFLNTDGYVYPCNSISLSPVANRNFPKKYSMCHMDDIGDWLESDIGEGCINTNNEVCDSCRFYDQNEFLNNLLNEEIIHKEHI